MREINPNQTKRAAAFSLWMDAPMPMVTIFKTLDVSRLVRFSRETGLKFHPLLCYCVGMAAQGMEEFYMLPVGKKLMQYDRIAVNTIIQNRKGEINSCDIPFYADKKKFYKAYRKWTKYVFEACEDHEEPEAMVIGTSAFVKYDVDGVVNFYSGCFQNPFLHWGRYQRKGFRKLLKVSFQFHHVQMDGLEACAFLERLQQEINTF